MTFFAAQRRSENGSGSSQDMLQTILYFVMACLAMVAQMALGAAFGNFSYIWLVIITLAFIYIKPELGFTFLLIGLFLQNVFVAAITPQISLYSDFLTVMATSFVNLALTALVCLPFWLKMRRQLPRQSAQVVLWMILFFIVIVVYGGLGFALAPFNNVLLYIRVYLSGGLLLIVGVAFGLQLAPKYFINTIKIITVVFVGWGFLEFFWTYNLYDLFDLVTFYHFKYNGTADAALFGSVADVINFSSRSYLNLTGILGLDVTLLRPNGPNLHPISYAYFLIFCGLVCFIYRSYFLMAGCVIILALVGAKGPMIIFVASLLLYVFYNWTRNPRWLLFALAACMAAYFAIGIVYGLYTEDFHVIGFLGGLKGFMGNPLGHGVGAGGNFSDQTTLAHLQLFQNYGANYGFESAMGVMLYQIGIAMAVFLIFYWQIWKSTWDMGLARGTDPRMIIVPIVLAMLLVNGVFQEEALSPAGWGLWLLFGGFMAARHWLPGKAVKA